MCEIVDRLYDLLDPWDRPFDTEKENKACIEDALENDPKAIIEDLLDRLEDMI